MPLPTIPSSCCPPFFSSHRLQTLLFLPLSTFPLFFLFVITLLTFFPPFITKYLSSSCMSPYTSSIIYLPSCSFFSDILWWYILFCVVMVYLVAFMMPAGFLEDFWIGCRNPPSSYLVSCQQHSSRGRAGSVWNSRSLWRRLKRRREKKRRESEKWGKDQGRFCVKHLRVGNQF